MAGGGEPRVLLDGTPLVGARTGVGRYTACLIDELTSTVDVSLIGLTLRGWRELRRKRPETATVTGIPLVASALHSAWARVEFPPIELLARGQDLVHGTNFVLPPSCRGRGVVTVHDLDFLNHAEQLPRRGREFPTLVRRSVRRAAAVCTPTRAVAESVIERFDVPEQTVHVTPLGVDRAWFAASPPDSTLRERYRLPSEYLVFVGGDVPRKGLSTVYSALDRELPPLVHVGPATTSAPTNVVRTGHVPDEVLRRIVRGASALVLPSRDEGFGLTALEALACGIPLVCSDIPALREVTDGQAVMVPYGDADALRTGLRLALTTPPTTRSQRRAHAATYTWRACAESTLTAYHHALA
ncbi:glycosyltransferase [Allosaccharopolyspora coralli]|uniref:Glycosyltransferase n=1 Tax=Allosaccharopolyspora coralli TaxID=2665642 RepID=A0A5Q3QA00_9PSEU|nr:glycosyltransferase family 1 protein [Allosaccharopolyspora coralli]QGK71312.1 glycosyltransferase [Allosaccharopolyspora coralli]